MKTCLRVIFTWLFVYIIVTGALLSFKWLEIEISLPLKTFILTAFLVPLMLFILGPMATNLAHRIIKYKK